MNKAVASENEFMADNHLSKEGGFKKAVMSSEIPGYGFRHPFVAYRRGKYLRKEEATVWTEERTVHQVEDSEEFLLLEVSLRKIFLKDSQML